MNEKVKQIFDILGVEPEEEFRLNQPSSTYRYMIDNELYPYYFDSLKKNWRRSEAQIADIIKYGIIKIPQKPKLTNKDKIAIKFLKNCGFHYVVYEKDKLFDVLHVYENKPEKKTTATGGIVWIGCGADHYLPITAFDLPIDYKEPLCLDDFTDEDLKED